MNHAFVIDPYAREIITIPRPKDNREIYAAGGYDIFSCVYLEREANPDVLYIDDEGLFKKPLVFFCLTGFHQPLAGRGVVMGSDDEGDNTDPKITLAGLKKRIWWWDYRLSPGGVNPFAVRGLSAEDGRAGLLTYNGLGPLKIASEVDF